MSKTVQSKTKTHRTRIQRVARRLRNMGLHVKMAHAKKPFDLYVRRRGRENDPTVTVAVRVAYIHQRRQHVAVKSHDYWYDRRMWEFNFHRRGEVEEQYTDVFICHAANGMCDNRDVAVFVIPWEAIKGRKTFSMLDGEREYSGRFAFYLGRWDLVQEAVVAKAQAVRAGV